MTRYIEEHWTILDSASENKDLQTVCSHTNWGKSNLVTSIVKIYERKSPIGVGDKMQILDSGPVHLDSKEMIYFHRTFL